MPRKDALRVLTLGHLKLTVGQMEELFRTLRHRMSWTNAKKILQANGIATSHGWDGSLKKIEASGQEINYGQLEDALIEHLLCGEKFTKLYAVDPALRKAIQNKLLSVQISDAPAAKSYPYLVADEELAAGTGDMAVVRVESNEDGVGLLLSSVFWVRTREEIAFQEFDDPAGMRALYDEIVGLKRQPVQLFHVIWMPHDRDFLEIRVDYPRGTPEADVHGLHSVIKTIENKWGVVKLEMPVNLFPGGRAVRWQLAKTHRERLEILEESLVFCFKRLVDTRGLEENRSEDELTMRIADMLVSGGICATHDRHVNGHCDLIVEHSSFMWLGKAKVHKDYGWLEEGFLQLSQRYGTAMLGRDHGELIIYHRKGDSFAVLIEWRDRLTAKYTDVTITQDIEDSNLSFRTRHKCLNSGCDFFVRHSIVPLMHAPIK